MAVQVRWNLPPVSGRRARYQVTDRKKVLPADSFQIGSWAPKAVLRKASNVPCRLEINATNQKFLLIVIPLLLDNNKLHPFYFCNRGAIEGLHIVLVTTASGNTYSLTSEGLPDSANFKNDPEICSVQIQATQGMLSRRKKFIEESLLPNLVCKNASQAKEILSELCSDENEPDFKRNLRSMRLGALVIPLDQDDAEPTFCISGKVEFALNDRNMFDTVIPLSSKPLATPEYLDSIEMLQQRLSEIHSVDVDIESGEATSHPISQAPKFPTDDEAVIDSSVNINVLPETIDYEPEPELDLEYSNDYSSSELSTFPQNAVESDFWFSRTAEEAEEFSSEYGSEVLAFPMPNEPPSLCKVEGQVFSRKRSAVKPIETSSPKKQKLVDAPELHRNDSPGQISSSIEQQCLGGDLDWLDKYLDKENPEFNIVKCLTNDNDIPFEDYE